MPDDERVPDNARTNPQFTFARNSSSTARAAQARQNCADLPTTTMPRYVAFLRGVSPLNAKMPELKRCFEAAGFADVRTVLSSGNVAFTARSTAIGTLERKAEAIMRSELGRTFGTIVRPARDLQRLVEADAFAEFKLPAAAKRVITFLRQPPHAHIALPIEQGGARILERVGSEVFSAYVPNAKGPVFMRLLERTFGRDITTRTLETVRKCALA